MTEQQAMRMALEALEANDKLINGEGDCFGLEGAMDGYYSGCFDVEGVNKKTNEAITALRQALEQQPSVVSIDTLQERVENSKQNRHEQQPADEPVAMNWSVFNTGAEVWDKLSLADAVVELTPARLERGWSAVCVINKDNPALYTRPQPAAWVSLTDEEIKRIGKLDWDSNYVGLWYDFAKAIEAKLKEKNT